MAIPVKFIEIVSDNDHKMSVLISNIKGFDIPYDEEEDKYEEEFTEIDFKTNVLGYKRIVIKERYELFNGRLRALGYYD